MSRLLHTQVDLELLNSIDMDMKWNVRKKGRTNIARRPRTEDFEFGNGIPEPASFETKKSGAKNVVDASSKKTRSLHQSPSSPAQTLFLIGEGVLSPGPQTPALHNEEFGQKTKSRTRLRNNNVLKPTKNEVFDQNDFSGIELLAAAACSSLIHDNADHVEEYSLPKEHTIIPEVNSCDVNLDASTIQDSMIRDAHNPHDNGKEREQEESAPSKGLRLHWDLNTVMDEWEEPCNDLTVEPHSDEKCSVKLNLQGHESRCAEIVAVEERSLVDSVCTTQQSVKDDVVTSVIPQVEVYKSVEDLSCSQEVLCTKAITSKTSEGESCVTVSKSDVVDSSIYLGKCEELTTSTTYVKVESDTLLKLDQQPVSEEVIQGVCESPKLCKSYFENKVTSEDSINECRRLNVTQDGQSRVTKGDSKDKVQVGYDSPFEDGEFREPIENPLSEKVEACSGIGQTLESQSSLLVKETRPNTDIDQGSQADTFERPHIDESRKDLSDSKDGHDESRLVGESTSLNACRNGVYERQSRCLYGRSFGVDKYMKRENGSFPVCSRNDTSSPCVDSSTRIWVSKSCHEYQRPKNVIRNYDSRDSYRRENRRSSPSERNNNGYGSNRGPPARDRYRGGSGFHPQDYQDPKKRYIERKPRFFPNFSRPGTRSRSRSRSGSPIAWHFQKKVKNLDSSDSGEIEATTRGRVSPERSSKCSNDRKIRDDQFRDKRQSPARFDPIGYDERLKYDDQFRFTQRCAKFSQMTSHRYKDNDHCKKVSRVGPPGDGDASGARQFRYAVEHRSLNNFSRDTRNEHTPVIPDSKS